VIEGSAYALRSNLHIDIFRIVREALRNAFNHSQGRRIETENDIYREPFRIRIRDDGNGIDHDQRLKPNEAGIGA
jgi:Signal transduction histidine kinase